MPVPRRLGGAMCVGAALWAFGIALSAAPQTGSKCTDKPNDCERPVKFVVKGSCYVYACAYGTAKVHLINVDAKYKAALDRMAAEDAKKTGDAKK